MTDEHENPIRPEDLVAYAEGRLPAGSTLRERVDAYLRRHPGEAARVAAYRRQDELLHEAFDHVLDQPLPVRVQDRLPHPEPPRRPRLAIAASLLIGIAAGWLVAQVESPSRDAGTGDSIAESTADGLTGTATASDTGSTGDADTLLPGGAPDLSAAGLTATGNVALENPATGLRRYEYRDANDNTLQLLVSRASSIDPASVYTLRTGDFTLAYWRQEDRTYLLTGAVEAGRLQALAHETMATLQPQAGAAEADVTSGSGVVAGNEGENAAIGNGERKAPEDAEDSMPVIDHM